MDAEQIDAEATEARLREIRKACDQDRADNDHTWSEALTRQSLNPSLELAAQVQAMPATEPAPTFHRYPDEVPPRYVTAELEQIAKRIADRDIARMERISDESLDELAAYIQQRSGARLVQAVTDRRYEYAGRIPIYSPADCVDEILSTVRTIGHRIFWNDAREFELRFAAKGTEMYPGSPCLCGAVRAVTEDERKALAALRRQRRNRHPDDDNRTPPF